MQLTFEAQGDETVIFRADDDSAEPVAHIPWNGEPIEDHWRLVRTFVAAPAMLAALQAMIDDADSTGCEDCAVISAQFIRQAESAIAAALGESLPDTPAPAEWSGAPCPDCDDSGWIDDETGEHVALDGTRTARCPTGETECGQCEGTGTIEGGLGGDGDDESCPVCDGTGEIEREG